MCTYLDEPWINYRTVDRYTVGLKGPQYVNSTEFKNKRNTYVVLMAASGKELLRPLEFPPW